MDTKENAARRVGGGMAGYGGSFTHYSTPPSERLLSRLERVRKSGPGRWLARCPAHNDRTPSLAIRELDDGRLLLHCFSGCDTQAVLNAVGLEFSDLFPEPLTHFARPEARPFPAVDILRALALEALIVATAAAAMVAGEPLASADRDRLMLAAARIRAALDAGGLSHV